MRTLSYKKGADLTIENEFEMKPLDLLFME